MEKEVYRIINEDNSIVIDKFGFELRLKKEEIEEYAKKIFVSINFKFDIDLIFS